MVYVGIGSNVDRETNMNRSIEALRKCFGQILVSSIYECAAVGFDGDNFYNGAAGFETDLSVTEVAATLRQIEDDCGRDRSLPKFSARTLDIDLLLYGDQIINEAGLQLPRADILEYDFVLRPLVDIAARFVHPVKQQTLETLWQSSGFDEQGLKRICMHSHAPGL